MLVTGPTEQGQIMFPLKDKNINFYLFLLNHELQLMMITRLADIMRMYITWHISNIVHHQSGQL